MTSGTDIQAYVALVRMTSAWHQEPLRVRPQKARRETLADMYIVDAPLQLPCAAPGANIDAD